jgi:transposase
MAGVYKIEIAESEEDLKKRLGQQKTASGKERVQLLYLLKSRQAKTVQDAAQILGRHRVTVQEWMRRYREGGLEELLVGRVSTGRPRAIPGWAEKALDQKLQESKGFNSYGEICQWLEESLGITANYKTVHQLVYYRLKASPKVSRPRSVKQEEEKLEAFKKT